MIYVYNNKPYVKVANYLKEVEVSKDNVIPKKSKDKIKDDTIVRNPDWKKVSKFSFKDYLESKDGNYGTNSMNMDIPK